jgi:hypothetical protein
MAVRLFARLSGNHEAAKQVQFEGLPEALSGGKDTRRELPIAQILIIEEKDDGVYLYRFTADGHFGGDTWHTVIEDAKHQAQSEYGEAVGEWHPIPSQAEDSLLYARSQLT